MHLYMNMDIVVYSSQGKMSGYDKVWVGVVFVRVWDQGVVLSGCGWDCQSILGTNHVSMGGYASVGGSGYDKVRMGVVMTGCGWGWL